MQYIKACPVIVDCSNTMNDLEHPEKIPLEILKVCYGREERGQNGKYIQAVEEASKTRDQLLPPKTFIYTSGIMVYAHDLRFYSLFFLYIYIFIYFVNFLFMVEYVMKHGLSVKLFMRNSGDKWKKQLPTPLTFLELLFVLVQGGEGEQERVERILIHNQLGYLEDQADHTVTLFSILHKNWC